MAGGEGVKRIEGTHLASIASYAVASSRSAASPAFASFTFTIGATYQALEARADTSKGQWHLPHYNWGGLAEMRLPDGCKLVGVELVDDAIDLPSFRHPLRAAYVLGPERGSLSEPLLARCDYVVKIPTRFCINLAVAGAVVMYDRMVSLGRFAPRPVHVGGPVAPLPAHVHGPIRRFSRELLFGR